MVITGWDIDIEWDLDGSGEYVAIGRGTRCALSLGFTFNDVLDMSQGEEEAGYFRGKLLTEAEWSADCDMLCTRKELAALIGAALGQSRRSVRPTVRINMPGLRLTGGAVIEGLDLSADMDAAAEVSLSLSGCGMPEAAEREGVFDITFDASFG